MEVLGGEERVIKILVGVFYHTGLSFEKNHPRYLNLVLLTSTMDDSFKSKSTEDSTESSVKNAKVHPTPVTRVVTTSIGDRFSTKSTAMIGEGLVRYCIFVDPKSLTKLPDFAGSCVGKFCACFCTCVGGFENNRVSPIRNIYTSPRV